MDQSHFNMLLIQGRLLIASAEAFERSMRTFRLTLEHRNIALRRTMLQRIYSQWV